MFIPQIEKQSQQEIKIYQDKRLRELIQYLKEHSPYYQQLFSKEKIDPDKIQTLEDLSSIPTTTKDDLQIHNEDFICVDRQQIIDYTTTSGTLGDPVKFVMTNKDLDRLAYNEYISFACAGGTSDDIYQLMTTLDRRFMAGLAYFLGIRQLGAGIIRTGAGLPELQWDSIRQFTPTTLITVPSFLLKLLDYAEQHNIDHRSAGIKKAICIGEPIRNSQFELSTIGKKILDKWDIELFSTYASTEMATAFTECPEHQGGHHHPELIIVELLDDNENAVNEGETGEVTVSTLGVQGMPLLRFKTGDICTYYTDPCACGRNTMRLGPIIGRKQQMIKYKGTTLYPAAIYEVLDSFHSLEYLVEVGTNNIGTDEIIIKICDQDEDLNTRIKDCMRSALRVVPEIQFESPDKLRNLMHPQMQRKPVKFIDKRKIVL